MTQTLAHFITEASKVIKSSIHDFEEDLKTRRQRNSPGEANSKQTPQPEVDKHYRDFVQGMVTAAADGQARYLAPAFEAQAKKNQEYDKKSVELETNQSTLSLALADLTAVNKAQKAQIEELQTTVKSHDEKIANTTQNCYW